MTVKIRNTELTPVADISAQMREARPLPMGRKEFDEWADRIISGALVPADEMSQRFCLADMLTHLGPTESHKPDAYFIHCLRKFAVNQVAVDVRKELYEKKKSQDEAKMTPEEKAVNDGGKKTLDRVGTFQ